MIFTQNWQKTEFEFDSFKQIWRYFNNNWMDNK